MSAATVCAEDGCPRPAVHRGRCSVHRRRWRPGTRLTRKWRALALARDGNRCVDCGRRATVADHVRPRAEGGSDEPWNLRARCDECHARRHGWRPRGGGVASVVDEIGGLAPHPVREESSRNSPRRERQKGQANPGRRPER